MKKYFNSMAKVFHGQREAFRLFWHYVLLSKLHVGKYDSKRVVMLRLDLIGDCTMFSNAALAVRHFFSDREVVVVCLSSSKPIFQRLDLFNDIIAIDIKPHDPDYRKLEKILRELHKQEFDLLLQPQVSKCAFADIIAAAIKCNKRIAMETMPGNSPEAWVEMVDFLYDEHIPYPRGHVSEFEYYGAFVRGIGCTGYKTGKPFLPIGEQHVGVKDYYVLYPGGSLSQKFWPAAQFARLAEHIYMKTGLVAVILGVASEQWVSDSLIANLNPVVKMSVIDMTGKTNIFDVIDIIGNAKLVVSNDTSGVHIACATNTPSVANVGGWLYGRFLPYSLEDVQPGDHLPLVGHVDWPCFHCNWDWNIIEDRNPACLEHLKKGEPSSCIGEIPYEQMEALVDRVIKESVL